MRRIADQLGDLVTYGAPLVRQKRNAHNLHRDLDEERVGMRYSEAVVEALADCSLSGKSYQENFAQIANQIEARLSERCDARRLDMGALAPLIRGFHEWTQLF